MAGRGIGGLVIFIAILLIVNFLSYVFGWGFWIY